LLDQVYRSGEAYISGGRRYSYEEFPGGPTVERDVDFVYQPIKDTDGTTTGVFVVGVDLTPGRARASA
jgi:hypothetical protein